MFSKRHRVVFCAFTVVFAIFLTLTVAGCGSSSSGPNLISAGGTGTPIAGPSSGESGAGATSAGSSSAGTTSGGGSGSTTASGGSSGSGTTTGGTTTGGGAAQNPPTCDGMAPGVTASGSEHSHPLDSMFLYVADGGCKVAGFFIADDGTLKPTPGSPYPAPGETLVVNPILPILYSSDLNELASYSIAQEGTLHKLANYTKEPGVDISFAQSHLAIDPLGKAIYPVEGPSHDNQTIEVLTANSDGTLTHLQDFEVGPYVRSLSFTPDGTVSFGTECSRFGPFLDVLKRSSDGTLTWDVAGLQLQHPKSCPIAASMSPDGNYFAMAGIVSQTYTPIDNVLEIISSVRNDSVLAELKGSPYSIGLIGISDVTWHPSSEFLAVGAQNGVSIYRFQAGSTPDLIDGSPFGSDAIDRVTFNRAGTLLFATSSKSKRLYVFKFKDGKLIPTSGSPYALSFMPYNMAVVN